VDSVWHEYLEERRGEERRQGEKRGKEQALGEPSR
jgi:hypothetical protein